ncbi:MAG TPA: hypothetical protein PKA64_12390 [Myxococcota bacterium]|nr:hypothetical protein [Myxococcota bacterium]
MSNRVIGVPVLVGYLTAWWGGVAALLVYITSNTPPPPPEIKWKEAEVYTTTKLDVEIVKDSQDPDNNLVTYFYQWRKNGQLVEGKDGRSISDKEITAGDTWEIIVTPDDGTIGSSMCSFPWRKCAVLGENAAVLSVTVKDSPPRARVRFLNDAGQEVTQMNAGVAVKAKLACMDPDTEKERARAAEEATKAGQPIPQRDPNEPDPCTYDIHWMNVDAPPPAEGTPWQYTTDTLPPGAAKSGETWKAVVTASAGGVTGEAIEAKVRIL